MNGGGGADGLILFYYIQTEAEVEEKEGVRLGKGGWWQYKGGGEVRLGWMVAV